MNTSLYTGLGMGMMLLANVAAVAEDYVPAEYKPGVEYAEQHMALKAEEIDEPEAVALTASSPVAAPESAKPQEAAASQDQTKPAETKQDQAKPAETKQASSVEPTAKPASDAAVNVQNVQAEESLISSRNVLLALLAAAGLFLFSRKKPIQLSQAASEPVMSATTGVERYLEKVSPQKTGVAKYLEKQEASTPITGVAKYLAKQAVKNKT